MKIPVDEHRAPKRLHAGAGEALEPELVSVAVSSLTRKLPLVDFLAETRIDVEKSSSHQLSHFEIDSDKPCGC